MGAQQGEKGFSERIRLRRVNRVRQVPPALPALPSNPAAQKWMAAGIYVHGNAPE